MEGEDTPDTTPAVAPQKNWRSLAQSISIIAIAPVLAVLVTLFIFQSYQVDGSSMQNTLQNNDRLIVWKLPRTWARITGHQYVPKRGDVIIVNQQNLSACGQDGKQI